MHRLDVEGPGLTSETRMVSYEKDVIVAVSLSAREADAGLAIPGEQAAAGDVAKLRPAGIGSGRPKPPRPPALGIDEKDPYKR